MGSSSMAFFRFFFALKFRLFAWRVSSFRVLDGFISAFCLSVCPFFVFFSDRMASFCLFARRIFIAKRRNGIIQPTLSAMY